MGSAEPRSPASTHLHLVAVDIVVAEDDTWRVVELNDQPGGLSIAELPAEPSASALDAVAALLASAAGDGPVLLQLPDRFAIEGASRAGRARALGDADPNALETLDQFNALFVAVRAHGAPARFATAADLASLGAARPGAVFRRGTLPFPGDASRLLVVNAHAVRELCLSKRRSAAVLEALGFGDRQIPTFTGADAASLAGFRDRHRGDDDLFVAKAERGARGRQVYLVPGSRILRDGWLQQMILSGRLMLQPYLRPKAIRGPGGHAYAADLRLYFVGGRLAGGIVRRAAAAVSLYGTSHRAAWLPPGGRVLSLASAIAEGWIATASLHGMSTTLEAMVAALDAYLTRDAAVLDAAYRAASTTYVARRAAPCAVACVS
ncbi:MAG: hypothetical protein ACFE0R_09095 [Salinarimonas sp.]